MATTAITTEALARIALTIRQRTIETSARARIPHLGSCLSCVELLTALYWQELRVDPQQPEAPDRDRFVLSKGHGAPVLFQVLAERGFFPIERLAEFGKPGSVFHEHPPSLATSLAWKQPLVPWVTVYRWPLAWQLRNVSKKATAAATPS